MARLLPRSLQGQVMLVLAVGLLVGQAISGILLYRAAEQRRDANAVNQIALHLLTAEERAAQRRAMREAFREARERPVMPHEEDHIGPMRRMMRLERSGIEHTGTPPMLPGEVRMPRFESALGEILAEQGMSPRSIQIVARRGNDDPLIAASPRLKRRLGDLDWRNKKVLVAGIERADGNGWTIVRHPLPDRPKGAARTILFQTLVIFAVLFVPLFLVLRRMTRPLAQLTARVGDFSLRPENAVRLEERGPQDMRRLIAAHNAMEARIAAMLDEKDVMLGAIGHDLKTPLAALRVRIESVPDGTQRARMAESIEDITRTLDDILELARIGRPGEAVEVTDLGALVASVVEEYEDLEKPVEAGDLPRIALPLRSTLLRRAIRNLIDNALRYGKRARVSVVQQQGWAVIRIEDEGPGIPAEQIAVMLEPFQRGEASRNRGTGGAGLGLTLARAIALQHRGELELANRPEGGLRADIRLPTG